MPFAAWSSDGDHSGHNHDAATVQHGDIIIKGAWTRQTPPGAKVGGGYLTITNEGQTADRLTGGAAAFAASVEIHEMSVNDGVMKMAELADGLEIEPGQTVVLKPGGFHIMFMGLSEIPMEGDTVNVTLTFANAGEVSLNMPVAAIGATSLDGKANAHGGHNHSHGDHTHDHDHDHGTESN
ncbi:MAG: copper chaperone PCu(A)C [Ahrensia sp.]|nr:copper chaperone PCu(A)C [Ahrensia sp.]